MPATANSQALKGAARKGSSGPVEPDQFLVGLGLRIRALRRSRKLSRRALAERSGLSQRFIAQLEVGDGNISILRLNELLHALDADLSAVVPRSLTNLSADALAMRVATAQPDVRSRISDLLDEYASADTGGRNNQRVALIGLRGAGKSTLGRDVAKRLKLNFVELNSEIERANGLRVGEIFSLYGEEGYRRLEHRQLATIGTRSGVVLAVAGGIVDSTKAYALLRRNFLTIWLQASPEEHMARVVAQGDSRPMSGNPDAMDDLRRILSNRDALYARAHRAFDTSGKSVAESAAGLAALINTQLATATR